MEESVEPNSNKYALIYVMFSWYYTFHRINQNTVPKMLILQLRKHEYNIDQ